jgi:hypothetical protein
MVQAKETYFIGKRDLFYRQKRPPIWYRGSGYWRTRTSNVLLMCPWCVPNVFRTWGVDIGEPVKVFYKVHSRAPFAPVAKLNGKYKLDQPEGCSEHRPENHVRDVDLCIGVCVRLCVCVCMCVCVCIHVIYILYTHVCVHIHIYYTHTRVCTYT